MCRQIRSVHDRAFLHDEMNVAVMTRAEQRVIVENDEICEFAGLEGSELVIDPVGPRYVARRRQQGFLWAHSLLLDGLQPEKVALAEIE